MLPIDIKPSLLKLNESRNKTIVICTGFVGGRKNLRFQRFSLLMQLAFPGKVMAWFANGREPGFNPTTPIQPFSRKQLWQRRCLLTITREVLAIDPHFWRRLYFPSQIRKRLKELRSRRRMMAIQIAEEELLRAELEQLKLEVSSALRPISVAEMGGWSSPEIVDAIKGLDPYLIISFGCSLLPRQILNCARGISINQHSGWSPDLKGSHTIEWALYHRSLHLVGVTVHVTTTGADSGSILRRSWLSLNEQDDCARIFCRAGTLGTELILDVVEEIMERKQLNIFPQGSRGDTKIRSDYNESIEVSILSDEKRRWLKSALRDANAF